MKYLSRQQKQDGERRETVAVDGNGGSWLLTGGRGGEKERERDGMGKERKREGKKEFKSLGFALFCIAIFFLSSRIEIRRGNIHLA